MSKPTGGLTPSELEARRKNAQKSTGPRSARGKQRAALNALKYGYYSGPQSAEQAMVLLGEDPAEFQRFRDSLILARQPADAVELMLIEEVATLAWKKRRLDRAQEGLQVHSLEVMELQRHRQALEVGRESADISQAEVLKSGLRRAPRSPAKFGEILSNLDILSTLARKGNFAEEIDSVITLLYGQTPTLRGALIASAWQRLREEGVKTDRMRELLAGLKVALEEETRDVIEEYALYLQEHVHISPAQRSSALAPTHPEWTALIRHEYTLDRLIERKLKLLMQIQKARKAEERAARLDEEKAARTEKHAFLKNEAGELLKTKDQPKKRTGNKAETNRPMSLTTKESPQKRIENEPENEAGHLPENKGQPKNEPEKAPAETANNSPRRKPGTPAHSQRPLEMERTPDGAPRREPWNGARTPALENDSTQPPQR